MKAIELTIEDLAPFLGCEVQFKEAGFKEPVYLLAGLTKYHITGGEAVYLNSTGKAHLTEARPHEIKPILRPFSDAKEDEDKKFALLDVRLENAETSKEKILACSAITQYLIRQGFAQE